MRSKFEEAVAASRFSMAKVYRHAQESFFGSEGAYVRHYESAVSSFGKRDAKKVLQGILRFAFFVEPVKKPKIDSTKYAVRWKSSNLPEKDPRRASYEACLEVFEHLLNALMEALQNAEHRRLIQSYAEHKLIPYELPIDYAERDRKHAMHRMENVGWFWGALPQRAIELRSFLLDSGNHEDESFFAAAYDKIKVKSHLTDRVLTGRYKTNREKRWEVHPASVHFAKRKDCLDIETTLINQLCYFQGFPSGLQKQLEKRGLIAFEVLEDPGLKAFDDEVMRCPITLQPLSFEEFKKEVLAPEHGRASYQVGHMHPLKATTDNPYTGHTAKNVSWISAQGNRIQGQYSVKETRALIEKMIGNYKTAGLTT